MTPAPRHHAFGALMADDQGKQPHDRFFLQHLDQIDIVHEDGRKERLDSYVARKKRDVIDPTDDPDAG